MWINDPKAPIAFPKWIDYVLPVAGLGAAVGGLYVVSMLIYAAAPGTQRIGYAPKQPVAYSHKLHAGDMGMDCRYCHTTVDHAAHAAIPPTQTCMGCHTNIRGESDKLLKVRESHATGMPIEWIRVHDLPDFVYFDHSAHVSRGIGCVSCHGRVDKMEVVYQDQPLTMGWCLDCHRNPEKHLRPLDQVTNMNWQPAEDQLVLGKRLREEYNINPSTDCSTCHR